MYARDGNTALSWGSPGKSGWWIAIAVTGQLIQPNVYALLKQLEDSCILNTSLNAKSLVIFSKGKKCVQEKGRHTFISKSSYYGLVYLPCYSPEHVSLRCYFYRKEWMTESQKIWKALLYCISKHKSVWKWSLSGAKPRNFNSEKINKTVFFISVFIKTKSHPNVTVGKCYSTGCTTCQQ